ncbi:hypothetical protein [Bernardetia sp.]|uniref:hypothetical protein n=1 Tax=Bernardetia sp. TaxID=1937974 RepID=UPI0025C05A7F|nr:hypothetical protein [Bernardetia sp.]
MPYTQFNARELSKKFGIQFKAEQLFDTGKTPMVQATDWLSQAIEKAIKVGFSSEKSRSERIVSPILMELSLMNDERFTIYSGMNLNVDETTGLNGECDFMLSFSKIQDFVVAPIFAITEAKKQDIESGTIQCAAQLIAANLLNKEEGYNFKTLYGCSTTGTEWRFLKLENNVVTLDTERYFITNLPKLLSVLQFIIDESGKS